MLVLRSSNMTIMEYRVSSRLRLNLTALCFPCAALARFAARHADAFAARIATSHYRFEIRLHMSPNSVFSCDADEFVRGRLPVVKRCFHGADCNRVLDAPTWVENVGDRLRHRVNREIAGGGSVRFGMIGQAVFAVSDHIDLGVVDLRNGVPSFDANPDLVRHAVRHPMKHESRGQADDCAWYALCEHRKCFEIADWSVGQSIEATLIPLHHASFDRAGYGCRRNADIGQVAGAGERMLPQMRPHEGELAGLGGHGRFVLPISAMSWG